MTLEITLLSCLGLLLRLEDLPAKKTSVHQIGIDA